MKLRRRGALVAATIAVTAGALAPAGTASASAAIDPVQCVKDSAYVLADWALTGRPIEPVAC